MSDIEQHNNKLVLKSGGVIDAPGGDDYSLWLDTEEKRRRYDTSQLVREKVLSMMENAGGDKKVIRRATRQLNQDLMDFDPNYNETVDLYREMKKAFPDGLVASMTPQQIAQRVDEVVNGADPVLIRETNVFDEIVPFKRMKSIRRGT